MINRDLIDEKTLRKIDKMVALYLDRASSKQEKETSAAKISKMLEQYQISFQDWMGEVEQEFVESFNLKTDYEKVRHCLYEKLLTESHVKFERKRSKKLVDLIFTTSLNNKQNIEAKLHEAMELYNYHSSACSALFVLANPFNKKNVIRNKRIYEDYISEKLKSVLSHSYEYTYLKERAEELLVKAASERQMVYEEFVGLLSDFYDAEQKNLFNDGESEAISDILDAIEVLVSKQQFPSGDSYGTRQKENIDGYHKLNSSELANIRRGLCPSCASPIGYTKFGNQGVTRGGYCPNCGRKIPVVNFVIAG